MQREYSNQAKELAHVKQQVFFLDQKFLREKEKLHELSQHSAVDAINSEIMQERSLNSLAHSPPSSQGRSFMPDISGTQISPRSMTPRSALLAKQQIPSSNTGNNSTGAFAFHVDLEALEAHKSPLQQMMQSNYVPISPRSLSSLSPRTTVSKKSGNNKGTLDMPQSLPQQPLSSSLPSSFTYGLSTAVPSNSGNK